MKKCACAIGSFSERDRFRYVLYKGMTIRQVIEQIQRHQNDIASEKFDKSTYYRDRSITAYRLFTYAEDEKAGSGNWERFAFEGIGQGLCIRILTGR